MGVSITKWSSMELINIMHACMHVVIHVPAAYTWPLVRAGCWWKWELWSDIDDNNMKCESDDNNNQQKWKWWSYYCSSLICCICFALGESCKSWGASTDCGDLPSLSQVILRVMMIHDCDEDEEVPLCLFLCCLNTNWTLTMFGWGALRLDSIPTE